MVLLLTIMMHSTKVIDVLTIAQLIILVIAVSKIAYKMTKTLCIDGC